MGRPRLPGPLDPLFRALGAASVEDFADTLNVSRQTVRRWQQGRSISDYNKLKINLLFIGRGLKPPFRDNFGRARRPT